VVKEIYKEFLVSLSEFHVWTWPQNVNNCVTKMVKISATIITLHMNFL